MSLRPCLICSRRGRLDIACDAGVREESYDMEDMKRPKAPPSAKPMTPDMTDLPRQDSMAPCIARTICASCSFIPAVEEFLPAPPGNVDMVQAVWRDAGWLLTWKMEELALESGGKVGFNANFLFGTFASRLPTRTCIKKHSSVG